VPDASITARARKRRSGPALVHDQLERRFVAAVVLELVHSVLRDGEHARAEMQALRDRRVRGQGLEVAVDDLVAGRIALRRWRDPARTGQQPCGRGIDVELPRREHAHVAPLTHACSDALARLEDQRFDVARQQVRGRGQADGTGADDGDGKRGCCGHDGSPVAYIDVLQCSVRLFTVLSLLARRIVGPMSS
jgi:hypothetical protein